MENKKSFLKTLGRVWSNYSYIFVLLIILVGYVFTIQANGNSFKWSHIAAILGSQNTCIVGTIALGMAFIIITGQIDLSVGSSLVLCTGATIMAFNVTNSILAMVVTAILVGALCGLINGLLVGLGKMPPFVVTLGTMLIYRSLTLSVVRKIDPAISGSSSSQFAMLSDKSKYEFLRMKFGTGKLQLGGFSIPYITFLFLAMAVLCIIVAKKTKFGKSVYAVGSNEKSARLAGINVTGVKIAVFVITGVLVGIASLMQACKIGNVTPASSGQSYEMYAIAAVVLAGVNMAGGRGNMLGIIFGGLAAKGKEPSAPRKIAYGMLVAAIAYGLMVIASIGLNTPALQKAAGDAGTFVSPNWLISVYLILTFGELLLCSLANADDLAAELEGLVCHRVVEVKLHEKLTDLGDSSDYHSSIAVSKRNLSTHLEELLVAVESRYRELDEVFRARYAVTFLWSEGEINIFRHS